jgi:hypothetical protein
MAEDSSNLVTMRSANSPNTFDLRRVGAHPDYWYPLAWSDELKVGKTLGRRFAGAHCACIAAKAGRYSRWRIAAPIARCPCIWAW